MSQHDESTNLNLNSTKTPARPSHEAVESHDTDATGEKHIDHSAMESAKRAENRIHQNEESTVKNSIISK